MGFFKRITPKPIRKIRVKAASHAVQVIKKSIPKAKAVTSMFRKTTAVGITIAKRVNKPATKIVRAAVKPIKTIANPKRLVKLTKKIVRLPEKGFKKIGDHAGKGLGKLAGGLGKIVGSTFSEIGRAHV